LLKRRDRDHLGQSIFDFFSAVCPSKPEDKMNMFYQINFIAILYMSRAKNKRKQTNKKKRFLR